MLEKVNIINAEALKKLDKIPEKQEHSNKLCKLSIYSRSFKMLQTCICNTVLTYFYLETVAVIDADYFVFSVSFTK